MGSWGARFWTQNCDETLHDTCTSATQIPDMEGLRVSGWILVGKSLTNNCKPFQKLCIFFLMGNTWNKSMIIIKIYWLFWNPLVLILPISQENLLPSILETSTLWTWGPLRWHGSPGEPGRAGRARCPEVSVWTEALPVAGAAHCLAQVGGVVAVHLEALEATASAGRCFSRGNSKEDKEVARLS
jgi:hypothetical protein